MTEDQADHPVILYDGVCNLCNFSVRFVLRRDSRNLFRFASVQSDVAADMLARFGKVWADDTFYLVKGDEIHDRSTAALTIMKDLRFPWPLMAVFLIVPKGLRDWVYDRVARNRYRLFGRTAECQVPAPEVREKFLDL